MGNVENKAQKIGTKVTSTILTKDFFLNLS